MLALLLFSVAGCAANHDPDTIPADTNSSVSSDNDRESSTSDNQHDDPFLSTYGATNKDAINMIVNYMVLLNGNTSHIPNMAPQIAWDYKRAEEGLTLEIVTDNVTNMLGVSNNHYEYQFTDSKKLDDEKIKGITNGFAHSGITEGDITEVIEYRVDYTVTSGDRTANAFYTIIAVHIGDGWYPCRHSANQGNDVSYFYIFTMK